MKFALCLAFLAAVTLCAQADHRQRQRQSSEERDVAVDVRRRSGSNTVAVNAKNQNKNKVGLDRAVIDIRKDEWDRCRAPSVSFQPDSIKDGQVCADKQGNPLYKIKDDVRNWNACVANLLSGSLGNIFGVWPLPGYVSILSRSGATGQAATGQAATVPHSGMKKVDGKTIFTNKPKGVTAGHDKGKGVISGSTLAKLVVPGVSGGLSDFSGVIEAFLQAEGVDINLKDLLYDHLCVRPRQYFAQDPLGCYWQRTCPAGYFEGNPNGFCGCTNCAFSHIPYELLIGFAPWSCTNWQYPNLVLTGEMVFPLPFFFSQDLTTNCYTLNVCPDGSYFNPYCCACEFCNEEP